MKTTKSTETQQPRKTLRLRKETVRVAVKTRTGLRAGMSLSSGAIWSVPGNNSATH